MTCIVGLVTPTSVIIGGDSAGVSGYDLTIRKDPKVFQRGPFLIGYTTSFRMGQVLRFKLQTPPHFTEWDDFEYMATAFVDEVRRVFKEEGFASRENEREEGGIFLVGYRGRLYKIQSDYQVSESVDNFNACGCGEAYARGAMYGMRGLVTYPHNFVNLALLAAAEYSAGVRAPFTILELPNETKNL